MTRGRRRKLLGVLLGVLLGALLAPNSAAAERGLWVRTATWQDPLRAARLIADAAATGFTLLLLDVPLDDAPGASSTRRDEALHAFIASAKVRGLQVHAWVQASRILAAGALPASGDHPVRTYPEWVMVPRELATELARLDAHNPAYLGALARWARDRADEVDGLYLSPLVPAAAEFLADRLGALLNRVPFDGVQFESAYLPSSDFDFGALAVRLFREEVASRLPPLERRQHDARSAIDPRTYPDAFPQQWSRFRRSRVTALIARLGARARQARPGIHVSVLVAADPDEALGRHQQDWRTWVEIGLVDAICLAPGTEMPGEFSQHLVDASTIAGTAALWTGVAAHRLSPSDTLARIRTARRIGVDGLLVWSYDTVIDSTRQPPGHLQQIGLALSTGDQR